VVERLNQKGKKTSKYFYDVFTRFIFSGLKQLPNPASSNRGTWKPCIASYIFLGKYFVKSAHGCTGVRGRKKQMSFCNEVDTSLNNLVRK